MKSRVIQPLEQIEWGGSGVKGGPACPACGAEEDGRRWPGGGKHRTGCELYKFLRDEAPQIDLEARCWRELRDAYFVRFRASIIDDEGLLRKIMPKVLAPR